MSQRRTCVGRIAAIFQHPVKSMAGRSLATATLDLHGLSGDRRIAVRQLTSRSGFPWLSASHLPELLRYRPIVENGAKDDADPTHVETPSGRRLEIWGDDLRTELSDRFGSPLELMRLKHGMVDDGAISIISTATIAALEKEAGRELDIRRFRPNFVVEASDGRAFGEDEWVGKTLFVGAAGPNVAVTSLDVRCSMIGLDPDTAESDPAILKAAVRLHDNNAGVYGAVTRPGIVSVGDDVFCVLD